jgi:hypothetical protein
MGDLSEKWSALKCSLTNFRGNLSEIIKLAKVVGLVNEDIQKSIIEALQWANEMMVSIRDYCSKMGDKFSEILEMARDLLAVVQNAFGWIGMQLKALGKFIKVAFIETYHFLRDGICALFYFFTGAPRLPAPPTCRLEGAVRPLSN